MPRKRDLTPPLRRHINGNYYINLNGRRIYLGRDFDKAEAKRKELIAKALLEPAQRPKISSVGRALNAYDKAVLESQSDPGYRARFEIASKAVVELYGELPVDDFDQLALQRVRVHLLKMTSERTGRPLARTYVNHLVNAIKQMWTWLVSQKLAPNGSDVALRSVRSIRAGQGGEEPPRVVPVEAVVITATLPYLPPIVAAMVQVQQFTGMRPGEVVRLRGADISREPGVKLILPNTKPPQRVGAVQVECVTIWVYVPRTHKTIGKGRHRLIPIGPRAQAVLLPYLGRDPDAYLFSPMESVRLYREQHKQRKTIAKSRRPGLRYTSQSYARCVEKAVERANRATVRERTVEPLPYWSPGQLRHWAATEAEEAGGRVVSQALLGHANPTVTAVYAEASLRTAAAYLATHG